MEYWRAGNDVSTEAEEYLSLRSVATKLLVETLTD
jgi:hypothetical protein